MKRSDLLSLLRTAGYHDDKATYTRLVVEHNIDFEKASHAFIEGVKAKKLGVVCECSECCFDGRHDHAMQRH